LGFLGAWFFIILAPTSSIIPIASQTIAEHRMYLPLAAVIVFIVTLLYSWGGGRTTVVLFALSAILGWTTIQRNKDYHSELTLWTQTVAAWPTSERAHVSLGFVLCEKGDLTKAAEAFRTALRIHPHYAQAYCALGLVQNLSGRPEEAIGNFQKSLRLKPDYAVPHIYWGFTLMKLNRTEEALEHFSEGVRLEPDNPEFHNFLGRALVIAGRLSEAIGHFQSALRLDPADAKIRKNLQTALDMMNRTK
jgi:tetratricopeptide (TPR) repeat protein